MQRLLNRLRAIGRRGHTWHQLSASGLRAALESASPPILLDVRPPQQYAEGHLPGAWNVPLDRLAEVAGGLDRDRPVVVY